MIKYNTYKTVSKVSLYGDDDELLNNSQSVYKTNNSPYINCKKVKFNLNGSFNHLNQLSNNARLMLESSFIQGEQPIPIIWYKFDDSTNIGLDSMGNANLVKSGSFAVPTYDTTQYIIGSGSVKSTAGQMLTTPYTFSDINDALTISFWMRISSLAFA